MKKKLKWIAVAVTLVITAAGANAQQNNDGTNSNWMSEKGYWVIQTSKNNPAAQTVFFYNQENRLISQKEFKGNKLKPGSKKTKIKLKKALDAALNTPTYSMGEADQPIDFAKFN